MEPDAENAVASTFLPLEFFDSDDMESLPPSIGGELGARFMEGAPYMARSKYHGIDGTVSLMPCEVVAYHADELKIEIQWLHNVRRKRVTRCARRRRPPRRAAHRASLRRRVPPPLSAAASHPSGCPPDGLPATVAQAQHPLRR